MSETAEGLAPHAERVAEATITLKRLTQPIPYAEGVPELHNILKLQRTKRYQEATDRLDRLLHYCFLTSGSLTTVEGTEKFFE